MGDDSCTCTLTYGHVIAIVDPECPIHGDEGTEPVGGPTDG